MENWKMISIVIGIFGALLGVYFREAVRLANNQKSITSRLNAYLLHWQTIILEEDGVFDITYIGTKWYKDYMKLIKSGSDINEIAKLNNEYEDKLKEIKENILNGNNDIKINEKELSSRLNKIKHRMPELLETLKLSRQNIIDGKTFITDESASYLGIHSSACIIELKMRLISVLDIAHVIFYDFSQKDDFKIKDNAEEIYKLIRYTILFSKAMEMVKLKVQYFQSCSTLSLTFKNMTGQL